MVVLGGMASRRRAAVVVGLLVVLGVVGSVVGVLLTRDNERRFTWSGGGDAPLSGVVGAEQGWEADIRRTDRAEEWYRAGDRVVTSRRSFCRARPT